MLEIAVVFPGDPRAAGTWSGTPRGVVGGLEDWGARVHGVSAEPPGSVDFVVRNLLALPHLLNVEGTTMRSKIRTARAIARAGPTLNRLYGATARGRLARSGSLDGTVQIGTGYALDSRCRYVTFEDLTVPQALALDYPEYRGLSRRAVATRLATQRRAYDDAVACCFTTRWAAASAILEYGVPPEKVHVAGVGRNHVRPAPPDRDWTVPRFLFVGVEWERKNGPGVLRAFRRVREERPHARLDVVGRHPPLPEQDGVTTHGFLRLDVPAERAQVEALFATSTCFVMPSHYEPSALAYIEAGVSGIPSIGTTVGGAAELIGEGGLTVDPENDDELAAAMVHLADPETAAALGRAAENRAHLYTWRLVAERLVRALAPPGVDLADLAGFLE